jgi:mono/diheme cytochrome c family protein
MRRLYILVPTILVFLSLTTSVAFAQDPDAGKQIWGKQIWQCAACHGQNGEGAYGPPLSSSTLTADEWVTQVRTPRRFMPSFSPTQVSDQQIKDIQAYVTSLPKPTGEFKRTDPGITTDDPGQKLMIQKNCVACHDAVKNGTGSPVDSFIKQGKTPTAEIVIKQLRTPFKNMPSFSDTQVTDAEAGQIADYLAKAVAAAQQAAPSSLPTSGGDTPTNLPLLVLLAGAGLALSGLALRRLLKN